MDDSVLVNVLNSWQNLLHETDSFCLIESFPFYDVVEELPSLGILHDKVDVCFGLDYFIELDDVGMSEYF